MSLASDQQLPSSAGFASACLRQKIQVLDSMENAAMFATSQQVSKECRKAVFQRQVRWPPALVCTSS